MSMVKTLAKDFAGEGCLSSIGNVAMVEDDAMVDSFFKAAARLFNEHGRPLPSEIASSAPCAEEGHLSLEPEPFHFGAQTFLSRTTSASTTATSPRNGRRFFGRSGGLPSRHSRGVARPRGDDETA